MSIIKMILRSVFVLRTEEPGGHACSDDDNEADEETPTDRY